MNLEEAIVVIKPQLDDLSLKELIKYIDLKAIENMRIKKGLDLNIRNVIGYTLKKNDIDKKYFDIVQKIMTTNYIFYKIKFPLIHTDKLSQVDLLRYDVGGKYEIHTDHGFNIERTLTCIINLNNEYKGGDFVFYKQNGKDEMKRVKCEKGMIIFFPSNFLYPHKVEPILEGTRYSIVSWLT